MLVTRHKPLKLTNLTPWKNRIGPKQSPTCGTLSAGFSVRRPTRRARLALVGVETEKLPVGTDADRRHELDNGEVRCVCRGRGGGGPGDGPSDRGRQHHLRDRVRVRAGLRVRVIEGG